MASASSPSSASLSDLNELVHQLDPDPITAIPSTPFNPQPLITLVHSLSHPQLDSIVDSFQSASAPQSNFSPILDSSTCASAHLYPCVPLVSKLIFRFTHFPSEHDFFSLYLLQYIFSHTNPHVNINQSNTKIDSITATKPVKSASTATSRSTPPPSFPSSLLPLRSSLTSLLSNKLPSRVRLTALQLIQSLFQHYSHRWAVVREGKANEFDGRFVQVVLNTISVEIQVQLIAHSPTQTALSNVKSTSTSTSQSPSTTSTSISDPSSVNLSLLYTSFSLLSIFLSSLLSESDDCWTQLPSSVILQFQSRLVDTYKGMIKFIQEQYQQQQPQQQKQLQPAAGASGDDVVAAIVLRCISSLCEYWSEEYTSLREEAKSVLPFALQCASQAALAAVTATHATPSTTTPTTSSLFLSDRMDIHPLVHFGPVLLNWLDMSESENDGIELVEAVISSGADEAMVAVVEMLMKLQLQVASSMEGISTEPGTGTAANAEMDQFVVTDLISLLQCLYRVADIIHTNLTSSPASTSVALSTSFISRQLPRISSLVHVTTQLRLDMERISSSASLNETITQMLDSIAHITVSNYGLSDSSVLQQEQQRN